MRDDIFPGIVSVDIRSNITRPQIPTQVATVKYRAVFGSSSFRVYVTTQMTIIFYDKSCRAFDHDSCRCVAVLPTSIIMG